MRIRIHKYVTVISNLIRKLKINCHLSLPTGSTQIIKFALNVLTLNYSSSSGSLAWNEHTAKTLYSPQHTVGLWSPHGSVRIKQRQVTLLMGKSRLRRLWFIFSNVRWCVFLCSKIKFFMYSSRLEWKRQMEAWSYTIKHTVISSFMQISLRHQAASLFIRDLYIIHPADLYRIRSAGFIKMQRGLMNPRDGQLHHIMWTFVQRIHYSVKYQVGVTIACPSVLPLLFLSFILSSSFLISRHAPRWSDGSQRQIGDDVSPFPRATAPGASHPQSERGPGEGERSRSSCSDCNLRVCLRRARSSPSKFTSWPG